MGAWPEGYLLTAAGLEVAARRATTDDLADLGGLFRASVADVRGQRGGGALLAREAPEGTTLSRAAIERALGDAERLVVVGVIDGAAVGGCLAVLETLVDASLLARIEWLYVDSGARSVGLGEEMTSFVAEWGRARGAVALDAFALVGDREVKNFLESGGFTARLIVMRRALD